MSFQDIFQQNWVIDEQDLKLRRIAEQYDRETEAYDRTVCSGPIRNGSIVPVGSHELGLVGRNARRVRERLLLENPEFTASQLRKAISEVRHG